MKPCPFCGSGDLERQERHFCYTEYCFISCTDCGAEGPKVQVDDPFELTQEELKEIKNEWNTRRKK